VNAPDGAGMNFLKPQSPVGLPTDNIDQTGSITVNAFGPNVGSILNQWTYSYKDVATKIIGRNTLSLVVKSHACFTCKNAPAAACPATISSTSGISSMTRRIAKQAASILRPVPDDDSPGRPHKHLGLLCPG